MNPPPLSNGADDVRPGDELWIGRAGQSLVVEIFITQGGAERWIGQAPHRRVWKITVAAAEEYLLTKPVPPRLIPKGSPS